MKIAALAVLALGAIKEGRAQSAVDGFDPDPNGSVLVVVVQPDGKILLGGDFAVLGPNGGPLVTRNRLARLNADGTLDTSFNPNATGRIYAIALQADGKILVGGSFNGPNSIGGQLRNYIARLDPTTGLPDSFDPNANSDVFSLAVQADGKILVGGDFNFTNSIGGATRNGIARLDPATGMADSFDPNAGGRVSTIVVQPDGNILVAGAFFTIGGQTRAVMARLNPTTGLADSFDPSPNSSVFAIAVQPDGKIIAGGQFSNIGGQARTCIARLNAASGAADSFSPNANGPVQTIAVQADGKILVAGSFSGPNSIAGQTRNRIARLDPTTGAADSFNPGANQTILSVALQSNGKIVVGGTFTGANSVGGATRNYMARLESDGRVDQTLNLGAVGDSVLATAVQPDGKMLIGGSFTNVLGVARNRIARLNTDGTLDLVFNPNANNEVDAIAVQADGKILVGGYFNGANSIGGQARNRIARLDATTGLADGFNPNANNAIQTIAVQADGKILAGGFFSGASSIGGQTRNFIARLNPATGQADSFDPNANSAVFSIAVQADGKILAGGGFFGANSIGGQARNCIARLDPATGLADSFNPSANDIVLAIAPQTDGKILVGGNFNGANSIGGQTRNRIARVNGTSGAADTFNPNASATVRAIALQADGKVLAGGNFNGANSIGGQARNRIARLDATTGLADSFDPNASAEVDAIALQGDGKILVGGIFASIGGQPRSLFARLTNDTAALQNISVAPAPLTWTRGGSSPQFVRVTFESSNDNVNYSPLGNGSATGSNWNLTGLNLPTLQNIFIRARGYYRSGYQNGSESIAESVRNAFLPAFPTPNVVSRKFHSGVGFDLTLPLTGAPGIECRSGGGTNDYQVVVTYPSAVTFSSAAVTTGVGTVSSMSGNGTSVFTINLTGISNAQTITLTLADVSNGTSMANLSVQMGVLLGDTTGNGGVNASDVAQTKAQSGQLVSGTNFRTDVNASGFVNATDISVVKSQTGIALPPAPPPAQEFSEGR